MRAHGVVRCVCVLAVLLTLPACEKPDPYKQLTVDQGARLLRDVRKNPGRVKDLSPAEKSYLIKQMGH